MRMALVLLMLVVASGCRSSFGTHLAGPVHRAAAARAEALLAQYGETTEPVREHVNMLRTPPRDRYIQQLAGREGADRPTLARALQTITNLCNLVDREIGWPHPVPATIPYHGGPIQIDGKLDDAAWQHALTYTNVYLYGERTAGGPATTFRLLWDERYLYVAWECHDSDLQAQARPRDGEVWLDDCVEIFILPDPTTRVYWELIITPAQSIFDALHTKRTHQWGMDSMMQKNLERLKVGYTITGTLNQPQDQDQGYLVEAAIPFDELPGFQRQTPTAGQQLHLTLARLDYSAGQPLKPYAFQPLVAWGHNLWNITEMTLGRETALGVGNTR
jgi:hypothetical protein